MNSPELPDIFSRHPSKYSAHDLPTVVLNSSPVVTVMKAAFSNKLQNGEYGTELLYE
jgi:hypothetical protein